MDRHSQRGQTIVLFAMVLVAIVAMVGLVIDGGATYGQRRTQQNAADMAALAGAIKQINGGTSAEVHLEATAIASSNFANADATVTVDDSVPGFVTVTIAAPHQNYFAGVVGQSRWDVTVTATAATGIPNAVSGGAPMIFSVDAFDPASGEPYAAFAAPFDFEKTTGSGSDAPLTSTNMAWTNLGTGSVSSSDVKNALEGSVPIVKTLTINEYIGQANNGVHNTLFDDPSGKPDSVNTVLAGKDVIVPIVGGPIAPATTCLDGSHTNGCFQGFALFHVVSATKNGGGEQGFVTGYFVSGFSRSGSFTVCAVPIDPVTCPGFHGLYTVKLVN